MERFVSALIITLMVLSGFFALTSRVKVWGADGLGQALSFDGVDDYVSVPPTDANTYAFELWFKPETNFALLGSDRFLIQSADQSLYVWHDVSVGFTQWDAVSIGSEKWHHLAVIIDYTAWQITPYLDGVSLGTKATTTSTKPPITWTTIGSHGNVSEFKNFKGIIDEVRIYNRTLSAAEVFAHYNSGVGQYGRPEHGLMGGWHFDEGGGTTAYEYSGNGNGGTIHGATWVGGHIPLPDIAITSLTPSATKVLSGDTVNVSVTAENLGTPFETFNVTAYYNNIPIRTTLVTNLTPNASTNLTFSWDTTGVPLGMCTIKANATPVQGEIDVANNEMVDDTVWIVKPPVASFTYSPTPPVENFTTTFDASNSVPTTGNVTGYTWDFGDGNVTTTPDPVITRVYTLYGTYNVTLTVENSANLTNSIWMLVDVLRHDVAAVDVIPYRSWIYEGWPVNINVTVVNMGNFTETATVDLYYNVTSGSKIGTETVNLSPSEMRTLTFTWNTTGVGHRYNYSVTAVATIPFDNNAINNALADGTIKVRILGDINGDDKVDTRDIGAIAGAFGTRPGEPRWKPNADLNGDGKTDLKDIALVARNFGCS